MHSKAIIVTTILSIVLVSTVFYANAAPKRSGQFHLGLGSTTVPYHIMTYEPANHDSCCWIQTVYTSSHRFVINDEEAWRKFNSETFTCARILANGTTIGTPCTIPTIDFSVQTVLVVFRGWMGSSAYRVEIIGIDEGLSTLLVHVRETVPAKTGHCMYPLELYYPYQMVSIAKTQLPIIFQTETVVATC